MKLSVVIPALNEEARLGAPLERTVSYLNTYLGAPYELIVVDDGSTDGTAALVRQYMQRLPMLRLVSLPQNLGRGGAVRAGVHEALGDYVLETDADGSVDDEAIVRFVRAFEEDPRLAVITGTRHAFGAKIVTPQPRTRVFLGTIFRLLARVLLRGGVSDYSLGFKTFRRDACHDIFSVQQDNRYIAEAEIIFIAKQRGWCQREMPVRWTDYRNSRVRPVRDAWRSLVGLATILLNQSRGTYGRRTTAPLSFLAAKREVLRLYRGLGWPSLFSRIRFFTAPYRSLEPLVPLRGLIIDLGSGYGLFSNLLALCAPDRDVLGLELDEGKFRYADRGVLGARFLHADITKIDTPPADAILLIHVLHHLNSYEEQATLLRFCHGKLASGGTLLICEIEPKPWWKYQLTKLADHLLYPGDRIYYRFRSDLTQALIQIGFRVASEPSHAGTPFSHITYVCTRT